MLIFLVPIIVGILQILGIIHLEPTGAVLCDLATGATIAAPFVVNALMGPKQSAPSMPAMQQANLYPEYQKQLLESGFNPRSDLYRLASEQSAAMLNRQAAQQGLARSGLNIAAQTEAQATLANKFLESETARRAQAYQAAVSPNISSADAANRYSADVYNAQRKSYDDYLAERSGLGGAYSNLITTGAKYFSSQPASNGLSAGQSYSDVSNVG